MNDNWIITAIREISYDNGKAYQRKTERVVYAGSEDEARQYMQRTYLSPAGRTKYGTISASMVCVRR